MTNAVLTHAQVADVSARSSGRYQGTAALLLGMALLPAGAQALEVTANVGFMSEYIFRGIAQSDSSANGGVDLKHSGFYLGTWAADVEQDGTDEGDGLEVDIYGGYNGSFGDLNYGIGYTAYLYTDDFDDDYREINLSLGYGILSVSAAFGEYDNFDGPTEDYSYVAPRIDYRGFYVLAGFFGKDFDGEHYEAGYGGHLEAIRTDCRASLIYSTDELTGNDSGDTSFVVSVTRSFGLIQ